MNGFICTEVINWKFQFQAVLVDSDLLSFACLRSAILVDCFQVSTAFFRLFQEHAMSFVNYASFLVFSCS